MQPSCALRTDAVEIGIEDRTGMVSAKLPPYVCTHFLITRGEVGAEVRGGMYVHPASPCFHKPQKKTLFLLVLPSPKPSFVSRIVTSVFLALPAGTETRNISSLILRESLWPLTVASLYNRLHRYIVVSLSLSLSGPVNRAPPYICRIEDYYSLDYIISRSARLEGNSCPSYVDSSLCSLRTYLIVSAYECM